MRIDRSYLSATKPPKHFYIEAKSVGLARGDWPMTLEIIENGKEIMVFTRGEPHYWQEASFLGYNYASEKDGQLVVLAY